MKELKLRAFEFLVAYKCIVWALQMKTGSASMLMPDFLVALSIIVLAL